MIEPQIVKSRTNKQVDIAEYGSTGTIITAGYIVPEEYKTELTPPYIFDIIEQMRNSDGIIKAMIEVLTLPIRSLEWENSIIAGEETEEGKKIKDFLIENLFYKLEHSWDDFLRQALLYLFYGCALFEEVYGLEGDFVILKKLSYRPPKTIFRWKVGEGMKLKAIEQRTWKVEEDGVGKFVIVDIPANKILLFVNELEGNNYWGKSIFRSCYRAWFIKNYLSKLQLSGFERNAIGIPTIKLQQGYTDIDKEKALDIVKHLRWSEDQGLILEPGQEFFTSEGKFKATDIQEAIRYWNEEMVTSILADFMLQGQNGIGSYAMVKGKMDFFLSSLQSRVNYFCYIMNKELIRELVDYNFVIPENKYPYMKPLSLGYIDIQQFTDIITKLVSNQIIKIEDDSELQNYIRNALGLPKNNNKVENKTIEKKEIEETEKEKIGLKEMTKREKIEYAKIRPLTKWEKKINLQEFEEFFEEQKQRIIRELKDINRKQIDAIIKQCEEYIEKGDIDGLIKAIEIKYQGKYKQAIKNILKDIIEFGKRQASEELGIEIPATPNWTSKYIDIKAMGKTEEMANLMRMRAINQALQGLHQELSTNEILSNIRKEIEDWAERDLELTGEISIVEGINEGIDIVGKEAGIQYAMYSCVLEQGIRSDWREKGEPDDRVCDYCAEADGHFVRLDDPLYSLWSPPNVHLTLTRGRNNACRCRWILIPLEDSEDPDFEAEPYFDEISFV